MRQYPAIHFVDAIGPRCRRVTRWINGTTDEWKDIVILGVVGTSAWFRVRLLRGSRSFHVYWATIEGMPDPRTGIEHMTVRSTA